jgi:hypothetical protein
MDSFQLATIIRLTLSYFTLFYVNIRIEYKIILFYLYDFLDCDIPKYVSFNSNNAFCKTLEYQFTDKITDTITYLMLYYYLLKNSILNSNELKLVKILLIFRIVGVVLFILTSNESLLFLFANYFLEVTFLLILLKNIKIKSKTKNLLLILLIFPLKLIQEYLMHIWKKN